MRILLDGLDQNGNAYWYIAGVFLTLSNIIMIYMPDIKCFRDCCSEMSGGMGTLFFLRKHPWFCYIRVLVACAMVNVVAPPPF